MEGQPMPRRSRCTAPSTRLSMATTRPGRRYSGLGLCSRGVKVRFISGTGSEALMGHAEAARCCISSARCLLVTRGGSQGVQNGSISCIALPESLPGGVRAVLAENLLAAMLGLEVATGNDALASHSDIRKTAKLMLQFIPGADFIFSGYSAVPKRDNLFGGGNFDAEDFDDYNVLQRDMIDGGTCSICEDEALAIRRAWPRWPSRRLRRAGPCRPPTPRSRRRCWRCWKPGH
ncbi:MAG: propanediol/glycerol family dehydratase large subunit [Kouleothrix sp.]